MLTLSSVYLYVLKSNEDGTGVQVIGCEQMLELRPREYDKFSLLIVGRSDLFNNSVLVPVLLELFPQIII